MPRSHQTFHPVLAVKLLGIMLRSRCWPTSFHTLTAGDANGWCGKWRCDQLLMRGEQNAIYKCGKLESNLQQYAWSHIQSGRPLDYNRNNAKAFFLTIFRRNRTFKSPPHVWCYKLRLNHAVMSQWACVFSLEMTC